MNTQNPAQPSALSAQDERVQPDIPLSGEVKRGGNSADPATWWFLENEEGRWLHNSQHYTFTGDPNWALKWPNRYAADAFRLGLPGLLWRLKLTEHKWIEPDAHGWAEFQDEISDAISDSMDMDWTSTVGARAVVRALNEVAPRGPMSTIRNALRVALARFESDALRHQERQGVQDQQLEEAVDTVRDALHLAETFQ